MARGTGITTRQLQNVKLNGVFICFDQNQLRYTKDLARFLGREDIRIETLNWLTRKFWRGLTMSDIVVDHFAQEKMSKEASWALIEALAYIGR